jgi:hypothetical protein
MMDIKQWIRRLKREVRSRMESPRRRYLELKTGPEGMYLGRM